MSSLDLDLALVPDQSLVMQESKLNSGTLRLKLSGQAFQDPTAHLRRNSGCRKGCTTPVRFAYTKASYEVGFAIVY